MNDIRNLVLTLFFAVVAAFAVAAFFVLNYGPSGKYTVDNTLLKPELLGELNYNDYNSKTGAQDRYIFDVLEYSWLDKDKNDWLKKNIDLNAYSQFYKLIENDESLPDVPPVQMKNSARLTIFVKTESDAEWQKQVKTFQTVEWVHEDYYRIELHEDNPGAHWVYFYHPQIVKKIGQLLNP